MLTGWLNGIIYWDPAGRALEHASLGDAQMTLDKIKLPWRRLRDLPRAYSSLRWCWMDDRLVATDVDMVAGMVAKNITQGIPDGYEVAMRKAGLTLPSMISKRDHCVL
jgi:hypothetical protein